MRTSAAEYLADRLRQSLGVRVRTDKPGTIQRMSSAHQSTCDLDEAEAAGRAAVALSLERRSDLMVTLVRDSDDPYRCSTGLAPLSAVANCQRALPTEFIDSPARGLTRAFERYALPLLGSPLPEFARLA